MRIFFSATELSLLSCYHSSHRTEDALVDSVGDISADEVSDEEPPCISPWCEELETVVETGCVPSSGPLSEHFGTLSEEYALHVFAIYNSIDDPWGTHPTGDVDIYIGCVVSPVILVLVSYEPSVWTIEVSEDAMVHAVYVFGFFEQVIEGLVGIPVFYDYDLYDSIHHPSAWWDGGDELTAMVEVISGIEHASYHGCSYSTFFTLAHTCTE